MSRVTTYLVGRDPRCHHRLRDPSVSRRHAEVVPAPDGRFYVTDCASIGGTFVRGREWTRIRQAWVGPSDRIRFGGHEMAAADLATPRGGRATPGPASAPPAPDPAPPTPAPAPPSPTPPAAPRDEKHRVRSPARDSRTGEIVEMREDP